MDIRDLIWVKSRDFEDLLALMPLRNHGFGEAQKDRGDEPPVPTKVVHHEYFNGSESTCLRFYGDSEKWKGNAMKFTGSELPVSTSVDTPTLLPVQTSTDFEEETLQRCGLNVSRL